MSSSAKAGLAALLIAAIALCGWWIVSAMRQGTAPKPTLGWQCSKCGHRFNADLEADADAVFSETEAYPKLPCPTCGGDAFRLVPYECTQCGHTFELTLAPDPKTGAPPTFACPKCKDRRIKPADSTTE